MNYSDKNPATETFDRLQKKTAVPIILVVATAAVVINRTSILLLPVALAIAAIYVSIVIMGERWIRVGIGRLRGRRHED
jgi:ABC-type transport system involved in cytochrome bd biosynthesis fused ATPase/permease subunit